MTAVVAPERPPVSGADAQNPWLGLVAFTEELQDFFHGRSDEADELLRRVERRPVTVLFGQSGLGKSSLLQAGLFPRLRDARYVPVGIRLDHATSAPALSEQVKAAVARAILDAGGECDPVAPGGSDTLWEHFHRRGQRRQMPDGRAVRLVLVFDQFEELFAVGQASAPARGRTAPFLAELADLFENRVPEALEQRLEESAELVKQFAFDDRDYRALVCLREDYLPHLESLRQAMPSITENRMRLTRMNGTHALEAILNPGGHLIAPEVARQVVRFVAAGDGRGQPAPPTADGEEDDLAKLEVEPALLSLVARELNNRRLALALPHITADLLAGNRDRILNDYYERCLADQPPAVRTFIEDELLTDSGLRENMAVERARKILGQHGAPATALDELVKRRLLHLENRLDIQRVELTHDVLTAVVKKSRDERQQREAREAREKARRQRRQLVFILAGMAAALVVVSGYGIWSYHQYRARVSEESQRANASYLAARDTADRLVTTMADDLRDLDGIKLGTVDAELNLAGGLLDFLETQNQGDPELRRIRARMYYEFAKVFQNKRILPRALKEAEAGLSIRNGLAAQPPARPEWLGDQALSLEQVGDIHREMGRNLPAGDAAAAGEFATARQLFEQAYAIRQRLHKDDPGNPTWAFALSQSLVRLGDLRVSPDKDYPGAAKNYQDALALIIGLVGQQPDNVDWQRELAWDLNKVGDILCLTNDLDAGLVKYEQGLGTRRYIASRQPDNTLYKRDVAFTLEKIARVKLTKKDFVGAKSDLFDALALRQELINADNTQTLWLIEFAETLQQLAGCMRASGDIELAGGFSALAAYKLQPVAARGDPRAKRDQARASEDTNKAIRDLAAQSPPLVVDARALREKAVQAINQQAAAVQERAHQAHEHAESAWNDLKATLLQSLKGQ